MLETWECEPAQRLTGLTHDDRLESLRLPTLVYKKIEDLRERLRLFHVGIARR